mgnify:CR=1 FL=1
MVEKLKNTPGNIETQTNSSKVETQEKTFNFTYDFLLLLIPLAILTGVLASYMLSISLQISIVTGSSFSLLAIFYGLFIEPPV